MGQGHLYMPYEQAVSNRYFMQAHQTSYRLPIRVLVQDEAEVWCTLGAKSGFLGASLVQKGQGICPDLESSGRVDWIRTSDPLTPSQVRYQTAPPPVYALCHSLAQLCYSSMKSGRRKGLF